MLESIVEYFAEDPERTVVQGCALVSATLAILGWRNYFKLKKKDEAMAAELEELKAQYEEERDLGEERLYDKLVLPVEADHKNEWAVYNEQGIVFGNTMDEVEEKAAGKLTSKPIYILYIE